MVTPGNAPPPRWKALPAFLFFALLGCGALWLCLPSLLPTMKEIAGHAPVVSFQAHDVIGLPLALVLFALAGMTLVPFQPLGPGRAARRPRTRAGSPDWLVILMGVAVLGVVLTVAAIPLAEFGFSRFMSGQRYLRCPADPALRHTPAARWVSPDAIQRCFRP